MAKKLLFRALQRFHFLKGRQIKSAIHGDVLCPLPVPDTKETLPVPDTMETLPVPDTMETIDGGPRIDYIKTM